MAHDLEQKWRSKDVKLLEEADFTSMMLSDRVLLGLAKAGFKKPSPIQYEAIPAGRFGKDLLVQAKSGTGKTLVFVVVALELLKHKFHHPQVLILVPTREIATQICSVVKSVGSFIPKLTCGSFIGGLAVNDDIEKAHHCQIVVGTLGRIKQLIEIKALNTKSIRLVVFDEADEMLSFSHLDEIDSVLNFLPRDKQIIATSATFPPKLQKIVIKYLRDPYLAQLDAKKLALLGVVHYVRMVESSAMPLKQYHFKLEALGPILKSIKFSQCLVFCNGIHKVETLYQDIKKWGFSATYISSNRDQKERLKAIECLKRFKCKVLVSSDVTSRGIDAEYVDLVVNFDVSNSAETHLHRSGRAGRYGTVGVNITIVDSFELKLLQNIEKSANFKCYKLPDPVPVDLIKNPVLDSYAIETTVGDSAEETEDSESSKKELNRSWSKEKSKEANTKKNKFPSKCPSDANVDEDNFKNETLQTPSDEDIVCVIKDDENNQSVKIENEKHSNSNGLSKSENVMDACQVKPHHDKNRECMPHYVDPNSCTCENVANNESSEKKSESNIQNVFSGDELVLDCNFKSENHRPNIIKNASDSKNLDVVAPSECEITGVYSYNASNCEVQNSSVINDCEISEVANESSYVSIDENFHDISETPLSITEDQSIKDTFQDDNGTKFHNLNKEKMTQAAENFIKKFESIQLSVSKDTDSESLLSENSETKSILSTQIKDLNSKQAEYYYKIFKLYQADNAYNHNEDEMKENLDTAEITGDEKATHAKENISTDIKSKENPVNSQEMFDDTLFVKASDLAKKLKPGMSEKFDFPILEKESILHDTDIPNFHETPLQESTLQCDKSNIIITTLFDRNALEKPEQKAKTIFEEISEESDSDEIDVESYLASLALPSKKLKSDSDKSRSVHPRYSSSEESDSDELDAESYLPSFALPSKKLESDSGSSRSNHPRYSSSSSYEDDESDEYAKNYYREVSSSKNHSSSSNSHSRRHSFTYSGNKKQNDDKEYLHPVNHPSTHFKNNRLHQTTFTKAFKVPQYTDQVKPHRFQHNCLHHGQKNLHFSNSSLANFCQQPNHSKQSKASQCIHHSNNSEWRQNDSNRRNRNMDGVNKNCHSLNYGQHSSASYKTSQHKCHPYGSNTNCNHREICTQEPNHSKQSNDNQCIHHSNSSECRQNDSIRKQVNGDKGKNKKGHSLNNEQHSPAYYLPSGHVCHPYDSPINCNHREFCAHWYQMFLNQWLYIQKCSQVGPLNFR